MVLGSIPMDRATQKLIEAFGEDQELSRKPQEKAAIAAVLVDRKGIPLEDNAVAISSFAWALPIALRRELAALGSWPDVELRLVQALTSMLRRTDPDGEPLSLDIPTIQSAFRWLVRQLGLASDLAEPPAFALRVYHYFKAKSPPEVQLLNSFFMGDLTKASKLVASGATPLGLRGYLGMDAPKNVAAAERRLAAAQQTNRQHRQHVATMRSVHGARIVDEQFFASGHETSHKLAPWVPDRVHRMREDLFIAAMDVHRAFIDAAAQKVMHNLGALMNVMSAGPPADAERRALLGDLWSTLFMAVPLVSTTFASVDRMLGVLPPGSIGWLLIDEAGQALPQAAVGAIMRARRTIAVGDPLQIPPVTSLPERLNEEVCRFFRVEVEVWAAPSASAQTLADKASRFQAVFSSDLGPRRVGIPLLVHRRCQEPMFGISNRIATTA